MTREKPSDILLVEDNESDVELTLRAFKKNQIANNIIVARDGEEALHLLFGSANHPPVLPILVLLDLKLPKIEGIEVLRRIRGNPVTRRLPVVVLTSSVEEADLAGCYDNGINSYVRKPVDFVQFAEAVRQIGLFWLLLNQQPPAVDD